MSARIWPRCFHNRPRSRLEKLSPTKGNRIWVAWPGTTRSRDDSILRPLLIVFLLVAILGLAVGLRHQGSPWALIVGILSALTAYVFIYVSFNE
jgi:Ca2+/Na+ antiporter